MNWVAGCLQRQDHDCGVGTGTGSESMKGKI